MRALMLGEKPPPWVIVLVDQTTLNGVEVVNAAIRFRGRAVPVAWVDFEYPWKTLNPPSQNTIERYLLTWLGEAAPPRVRLLRVLDRGQARVELIKDFNRGRQPFLIRAPGKVIVEAQVRGHRRRLSLNRLPFPRLPFSAWDKTVGSGRDSLSAAQTVTMKNTGTVNVTVSGVGLTGANAGDFAKSADTCTGVTVAPSGNCAASVTFTPTATGSRVATLSITDNAAGSPHTVALSGTGTDFSIAPASGSSTTATITAGQTATFTLIVAPSGFSGTVSFTCTGAPSAATCTVPASVMLDGSTPKNISVTVATTARSMAPPGSKLVPPHSGLWMRRLAPLQWLWLVALAGLAGLAKGNQKGRVNAPHLQPATRGTLALATMLLVIAAWVGCGGGGGGRGATSPPPPSGTPAGTYMLTVTGTAGPLIHETSLTLIVQ